MERAFADTPTAKWVEDDSGNEWADVAKGAVKSMEDLHQQMDELSDSKLESCSNNSEISGGDEAEMELANALNSNQDALERLERFNKSRSRPAAGGAHRQVDPAGPVRGDDPFWLEPFFQLMEKFDGDPSVNNMKKKLTLLSGCSGMLAEGWVWKAGLRKQSSVCKSCILGASCRGID